MGVLAGFDEPSVASTELAITDGSRHFHFNVVIPYSDAGSSVASLSSFLVKWESFPLS